MVLDVFTAFFVFATRVFDVVLALLVFAALIALLMVCAFLVGAGVGLGWVLGLVGQRIASPAPCLGRLRLTGTQEHLREEHLSVLEWPGGRSPLVEGGEAGRECKQLFNPWTC